MLERGTEGVFQSGREISIQELDQIQETVGMFPRLSRSQLAATICEHLGWITASGGYKKDNDEIAAIKLALANKQNLAALRVPDKGVKTQQGFSVGAVWLLYRWPKDWGLSKLLGGAKRQYSDCND